ncbi:MAG: hypothetical protein QNJ45_17935 [Ardenticatenaceae bacterium]|nr:hypothetical protein [Ardenticatenaceae bacterium]
MPSFDQNSRYANTQTAVYTRPDGEQITYLKRRFCPRGETMALLVEVAIADGDRLDLLTARALGDALQFWRVADANDALYPFDLMEEVGHTVRVPIPTVDG